MGQRVEANSSPEKGTLSPGFNFATGNPEVDFETPITDWGSYLWLAVKAI